MIWNAHRQRQSFAREQETNFQSQSRFPGDFARGWRREKNMLDTADSVLSSLFVSELNHSRSRADLRDFPSSKDPSRLKHPALAPAPLGIFGLRIKTFDPKRNLPMAVGHTRRSVPGNQRRVGGMILDQISNHLNLITLRVTETRRMPTRHSRIREENRNVNIRNYTIVNFTFRTR